MVGEHPQSGEAVALRGRVTVDPEEVRIDYQLENKGQAEVHVWDQLASHDDEGAYLNDRLAYVCWQEPSTVRVVRAVLRLPEKFRVGKKSEPYVRTVPPGKAAEGRIRLPQPLREFSPYFPEPQFTETVECSRLLLIIGWIEHRDDMTLVARELREVKVSALRGSWKPPLQRLARLELPCKISLIRYASGFDRRLPLE